MRGVTQRDAARGARPQNRLFPKVQQSPWALSLEEPRSGCSTEREEGPAGPRHLTRAVQAVQRPLLLLLQLLPALSAHGAPGATAAASATHSRARQPRPRSRPAASEAPLKNTSLARSFELSKSDGLLEITRATYPSQKFMEVTKSQSHPLGALCRLGGGVSLARSWAGGGHRQEQKPAATPAMDPPEPLFPSHDR